MNNNIDLNASSSSIVSNSSVTRATDLAYSFVLHRTVSFARLSGYFRGGFSVLFRFFAFHVPPFWLSFLYFISLWLLGSLLMMTIKPSNPSFHPRYIDMLYMSASALTVSGLNSVEMENFSSSQIFVLTLLMLCGGEVFTSLLALLLRRLKYSYQKDLTLETTPRIDPVIVELAETFDSDHADFSNVELGLQSSFDDCSTKDLKYRSVRVLGLLVLAYHVLFHLLGTIFILSYLGIFSSAKNVLKGKGINRGLFAFSVTVSSFANGGLIPTNENMMIFKTNTGILFCNIILILAGNTMFPVLLTLVVAFFKRLTRREIFRHMVKNPRIAGFGSLMPAKNTCFLAATVGGLIVAQIALYCAMDWERAVLDGLSSYQKIVSTLFMAVNSRHAGENTLDLSITSPAVLVLFIIMMYLPGSTSYLPFEEEEEEEEQEKELNKKKKKKKRGFVEKYVMSQVTCIAICVIAACITERKKISGDPLNFPVLNMAFEIMSAYGNVGLSTGYSCSRQIKPEGNCKDMMVSLSGKWSDKGKLVLMFVLMFGRLKRFTMKAGRAWNLT